MSKILIALLLSLMFHSTALVMIKDNKQAENNKPQGGPVKIVVKGESEERKDKNQTKPVFDNKSKIALQKKKQPKKEIKPQAPKGRPCEKNGWYGGIGIMGDQLVQEVYPGYPAFNAGLIRGDLIISPNGDQIRGEPGTIVKLKVMRGDKVLNFTITRGKICYVE